MKPVHVSQIRAFNRFYTGMIGLLDHHVLDSQYTLPEVRVLYEICHQPMITPRDIIAKLHIDKGYLSRLIKQFERKKLVEREQSVSDGRQIHLCLTAKGKREFEVLNRTSNEQIRGILRKLSGADCERLVRGMREIQEILLHTGSARS